LIKYNVINIQPNFVLTFNIPIYNFNNIDIWCNLFDESNIDLLRILFLFSEIVQGHCIGSSNNQTLNSDNFYLDSNKKKPKFCTSFEILYSKKYGNELNNKEVGETGFQTPIGVRVWLLCFDSSVKVHDSVKRLWQCQRVYVDDKTNVKNRTINSANLNRYISNQHYVDSKEKYFELCNKYLGYNSLNIDITNDNSFNEIHPCNPLNVFSHKVAFNQSLYPSICLEQMKIENYFSINQFNDLVNLDKPIFTGFKSSNVFSILPEFFLPRMLYFAPLPWRVDSIIHIKRESITDENILENPTMLNYYNGRNFNIENREATTQITSLQRDKIKNIEEKCLKFYNPEGARYKMSKKEQFEMDNVILRLRLGFEEDIIKMKNNDPKNFHKLYNDYSLEKMEIVYDSIMTSNDLPLSYIYGRSVWKSKLLSQEKYILPIRVSAGWVKESSFADFILSLNNFLENEEYIHTNHNSCIIIILSGMASLGPINEEHKEMLPHILFIGDPGIGKSYVLELAQKIAFHGLFNKRTYSSAKALSSKGDKSNEASIMEESTDEYNGTKGTGSESQSIKKDILSGQEMIAQVLTFGPNGERLTEYVAARVQQVQIHASNLQPPSAECPMNQRSLQIIATPASRFDKNLHQNETTKTRQGLEYLEYFRTLTWIVALIERMIESKLFLNGGDVNMEIFDICWDTTILALKKMGWQDPPKRKKSMVKSLARSMVLLYAVDMEFFSILNRQKEPNLTFSVQMLKRVEKRLFCTQEIALYVMTLTIDNWSENVRNNIVETIIQDIAKSNLINGKFNKKTDARKLFNSNKSEDRRYLHIDYDLDSLAKQVKSCMNDKAPNMGTIKEKIKDLLNLSIDSRDYKLESEMKSKPPEKTNNKPPEKTDNNQPNNQLIKRATEVLNRTLNSYISPQNSTNTNPNSNTNTNTTQQSSTKLEDKPEEPDFLIEDKNSPVKKIQVLIAQKNGKNEFTSFDIAIQYYFTYCNDAAFQMIKRLFKYKNQKTRHFLSSIPLVINYDPLDEKKKKKTTLYGLYETINIEESNRIFSLKRKMKGNNTIASRLGVIVNPNENNNRNQELYTYNSYHESLLKFKRENNQNVDYLLRNDVLSEEDDLDEYVAKKQHWLITGEHLSSSDNKLDCIIPHKLKVLYDQAYSDYTSKSPNLIYPDDLKDELITNALHMKKMENQRINSITEEFEFEINTDYIMKGAAMEVSTQANDTEKSTQANDTEKESQTDKQVVNNSKMEIEETYVRSPHSEEESLKRKWDHHNKDEEQLIDIEPPKKILKSQQQILTDTSLDCEIEYLSEIEDSSDFEGIK
jgi:hypothetical protein